jgi:hypothetical protein
MRAQAIPMGNASLIWPEAGLVASSRALYALTVLLSLLFAFVIVWAGECCS